MNHYAVIPSAFRPNELRNLVTGLVNDGTKVVVVDTGYGEENRPKRLGRAENPVFVVQDFESPKNISRWWNYGLAMVNTLQEASAPDEEFIVAILNDDVIVGPRFVQQLGEKIFEHNTAGAFPNVHGVKSDIVCQRSSWVRMSGFAFAMRGSLGLVADERLLWWYGDNDLEWQMFERGGLVCVADLKIHHLYPNSTTTGELAEQAGRDRKTFEKKWSIVPW